MALAKHGKDKWDSTWDALLDVIPYMHAAKKLSRKLGAEQHFKKVYEHNLQAKVKELGLEAVIRPALPEWLRNWSGNWCEALRELERVRKHRSKSEVSVSPWRVGETTL